MAADNGRQRRGRTDNGIVCNTKELYTALQRAKEVEDSLKSRVARLEDENATLRSRVDALRKATAPLIFKKIEGTEMTQGRTRHSLSPVGDSSRLPQSNFLPPPGRGQHNKTSGGKVSALDPNSLGRVVELERQLSALDKKRVQEVARWRKKYDELQEKWLRRENNPEHSDELRSSRNQLLSKSRVGRQSELLFHSQMGDELRAETQELREKNKQLVLENSMLCRRLEEAQSTSFTQDKQKTEKDVNRKYRDLLDQSERKIEELQRTNLKL
jgi:hypothetical protein